MEHFVKELQYTLISFRCPVSCSYFPSCISEMVLGTQCNNLTRLRVRNEQGIDVTN